MKHLVSFFSFLVLSLILVANSCFAQSLLIPGGANSVNIGDLDVTGDQLTVEALVTSLAVGSNIVSKHSSPGNVNYLLRPTGAELTTSNGYISSPSNFTFTVGECYHVALTYDGATVNYYVNGCLASSTPHTGTLVQNDLATAIGNQSDCMCEAWNGYIDEVRIWNVARTQADIQANMYDLPTPTTQVGLQAYFKFDGNYTNLQGNAAWNGVPIGAPQLQTNTACQNVDLSFQNSVTVTDVSCFGGSDGSGTIISTGGHPDYQYSVDGVTYSPVNTVTGLPAGTGAIFARSGLGGGCVEIVPVVIAEPSAITTGITGTDPTSCTTGNGTADLTVGGGTPPYTYLWSSGSTDQDPTDLTAGNNTVTITDDNQCTATESITLTAPTAITTTVTGTDPTCNGGADGTADLTVNNGVAPFTYLWSSGSTDEDPNNLTAGTSTVTVTDANQCTATESITLTQPTAIFPNAYANFVSANGVCDGGGVTVPSGGTPPYTYSWSNGQTTPTATGMCEGNQTIIVTDAVGCTGSQNIAVNVPACLTDVDFNTWVQAGQPANGNWIVENGGAQVRQTINGNPTFFVTPGGFINVRMRGMMRTTDADDDFMGVVFGFKEPLGATDMHDLWLFDWKQADQAGGQEGFALSRVLGTITDYNPGFWQHNDTPEFTVVATDYGNNGWNQNVNYLVEVTYTIDRAIILVDGDTIFDVNDCFEPGRFGFYNYSQQQVIYSDFTYELFTDFTIDDTEICAGETAQFRFLQECGGFNNLSQFDELQWDFGDGETEDISPITMANADPTHLYETGGNYTVRLIALDTLGCRDTIYKDITVLQNPTADFTFIDQCLTDSTRFTDATTQGDNALTDWNWTFGDGSTDTQQNPVNRYASTGVFDVRLVVEDSYGCADTSEQTVEIYVLPQADFAPIDDCYSMDYPFQDQSTISSGTVDAWEWDFGNTATSIQQNPTQTYATFGSYDVQLIALSDQGCGDTITQTIILHDNPVAGFELPQICQLQPFQLQDTSTIGEGNIVGWNYTFGDAANGTATVQDPTYAYQDAGTFSLQLAVVSDFGCIGTATLSALVDPKPNADLTTQNVCFNEVMDFQDQSSVASGNVTGWEWDFGDLNTDTVQNPSNTYTAFGNFTVELMVETDNGCRDTVTQQVEVYQLPVAAFNFADVCLVDEANFVDQSTTNSGTIDTWNWDLGDGDTENIQGPITHLYDPPDTYTVQLIVRTDVGCSDTLQQDIDIHPMPEPDFTADSVCFGQPTDFTDQSSILFGAIATYNWDFGFSATADTQDPTNIFPQTGYLPVTLQLTSDQGCKDTITRNIRVYVLPEPEFSFRDTCFEDFVDFANLSQIPEGSIDMYDWSFGDGGVSQLETPSHSFSAEGFYQTQLIATSNFGCLDSISKTVEIYPLPQLAFSPLPAAGCQPLDVVFDNQSSITSGYSISDQYWEFGNGQTSTDLSPQTTYVDSGFYSVMLMATTAKGCDDTLIIADTIDVWPRPIAGFSTDKDEYLMLFPKVIFEDLSFGATEWQWDFDDGGQSIEQNPIYEYLEDGTYQVIQVVNNDHGCDDEFSQRVIVRPAITFFVPNAFTPNNDRLNQTFGGIGEGIDGYQMWIFDRWGELLFYSADIETRWDGTFKGKPVEAGVYIYNFSIVDVDQVSKKYTGGVQLLR